ncbi:hypothetical protein NCC49_001800 [Naganishia albida]|nr:hypothetical protein NCC49_001800 [Naganishia albida]
MSALDLARFRVGLAGAGAGAGAHKRAVEKRAPCDLANGDLYLFPTEGSNLTSSADVTFKWNPTCLPTTTSIDLYLYTSSQGLLHSFPGVEYAKAEYNAGQFDPAWWNYTTKANVYLSIVDANQPRFLSDIPLGPTFSLYTAKEQLSTTIVQGGTTIVTAASAVIASSKAAARATATANVNGTAAGAASDDPGMFSSALAPPGGLSKAVMAVAIVVPIVVVALLVGLYVKFARLREQEKRKRWSEHVDRRMSVISADWRQGAPRASMVSAGGGARPMSMARSSVVSGAAAARPVSAWTRDSSVYAVENNIAGRGAVGYRPGPGARPHSIAGAGRPQSTLSSDRPASQLRPQSIFNVSNADLATLPAGVRNSHISFAGAPGTRQSRVSFGDTLIRPSKSSLSVNVITSNASKDTSNKRMSRVEPSPTAGRHSIDGALVSPSQADGPFAVPSVPVPARGGGVGGFFSSITSAVGKRDKNRPAAETEEDRRQAEATRRSADGIRDAESILLRRSQAISQYSQRSTNNAGGAGPLPSPSVYDEPEDRVEELTNAASPAPPAMGMMGMPLPGPTANPDQLLAAYAAARAGAKSPVEDAYADDK